MNQLVKVRHTSGETYVFSIQSHVSEGDKEKSDDAIIWYLFVTCSCWVQEGAADASGQQQARVGAHKRGMESSFHPTHTPLDLCSWLQRRREKSSKVKGPHLRLFTAWRTKIAALLGCDIFFPSYVSLLSISQMHRCFSILCVSLIFCATLSDTVGLVIAVSAFQLCKLWWEIWSEITNFKKKK